MGYISGHRCERINMVGKCILDMHITAELKAFWLSCSSCFGRSTHCCSFHSDLKCVTNTHQFPLRDGGVHRECQSVNAH